MSFDSWTVALLGKDIYNDGELVSPRVKGLNFVGASLIEVDTINGWVTVAFAGGEGGSSPLTDNNAIHDNVASEISAVTLKGTPANNDLLLIEDSAASNAKKRITVSSLIGLASTTDSDAIHDNVSGEIAGITSKTTPASGDLLLIEDSAASNSKKRITVSSLLGAAPVQSVFGRVGDVIAVVGDYVASQVNNDSTVVGATVAAALNTINTALASLVPTSRTLTAGAGLTGGGNLTANRTFDVGGSASITVNANDIAVNPAGVDHGSLAGTSDDDHSAYMLREPDGTVSDNRLMRNDGTTGRAWTQSAATEDDSGNVTGWASVTATTKMRAPQVEWFESGAGSGQQLTEALQTTGGVWTVRSRTNADGSGNDLIQAERSNTAWSRMAILSQYGLAEVVDSYSTEVDTASSPSATSIYKTAAGANVALTSGFAYEFEVSVWTHTAGGVGYDQLTYYVSALRTGSGTQLVRVREPLDQDAAGLDMQFFISADQVRCAPTVEASTPHRKVRWATRLVRRVAIVTEDT